MKPETEQFGDRSTKDQNRKPMPGQCGKVEASKEEPGTVAYSWYYLAGTKNFENVCALASFIIMVSNTTSMTNININIIIPALLVGAPTADDINPA